MIQLHAQSRQLQRVYRRLRRVFQHPSIVHTYCFTLALWPAFLHANTTDLLRRKRVLARLCVLRSRRRAVLLYLAEPTSVYWSVAGDNPPGMFGSSPFSSRKRER